MSRTDFHGAKVALICGDKVATILRDDIPHIPYPAHWDLTGGGRDGTETPEACALREAEEELGLRLRADRIIWGRYYERAELVASASWFFVAPISQAEASRLRLGDEGADWQMMGLGEYLSHPRAVPFLADRLAQFLSDTNWRV